MSAPPSLARIVDYWLGGKQHTPADVEEAANIEAAYPAAAGVFRAQRAYMHKNLSAAWDMGITQFLVFETGQPTANHAHQHLPEARVYYTDNDFETMRPSSGLLTGVRRRVRYQTVDPTDLENLEDLEFSPILDTEKPIGVSLIGACGRWNDEDLSKILANLKQWMPKGSYLMVSQITTDGGADQVPFYEKWDRVLHTRNGDALAQLLGDFELKNGVETLESDAGAAPVVGAAAVI